MAGPVNIASAMNEAAAHFRNRQFDAAEKICARVLKAQPKFFDALHLMGVLKLEGGKPAAALGFLESAAQLNSQSAQLLSNLARALAALDRDERALAAIDKALKLAPDDRRIAQRPRQRVAKA